MRASLALPRRAGLRALGGWAKCLLVAAGRCADSRSRALRTLRGSARAPFLVGGGGCAQSLKSRLRLLLGPVPGPSVLAPSPQPPGLRPGALSRLPGFFRRGAALCRAALGPVAWLQRPPPRHSRAPPARGGIMIEGLQSSNKNTHPEQGA